METKFRPIPITILDILAIFLPGFVWLILIATAFEIVPCLSTGQVPTPLLAWEDIVRSLKSADTWFAPFPLLVVSLLIGYLLKPSAIVITELCATNVAIRRRYNQEIADTKSVKGRRGKRETEATAAEQTATATAPAGEEEKQSRFDWIFRPRQAYRRRRHAREERKFPFDWIFCGTPLYDEVHDILVRELHCCPKGFPGSQIFATAKSYLKAVSPVMWEESERREAEVRMAGVMYLAFGFSFVLSLLILALQLLSLFHGGTVDAGMWSEDKLTTGSWLIASTAGLVLAGESFSLLRVSEVGYTYLNVLVACRLRAAEKGKAVSLQAEPS